MTIITILLAFFFDKYPQTQRLKHYRWVTEYAEMVFRIMPTFEDKVPWWGLAVIMLPLLLVVFIIQLIGYEVWFGLAGFVFGLFVLIYCLGNSHISQYFIGIINQGNQEPVTVEVNDVPDNSENSIADFINKTHQEVFAIVFWFILLGAIGAVLYRLLLILKRTAAQPESTLYAYQCSITFYLSILDWPSVRLLGLCLSLGGAFTKAFPLWWQGFFGGLSDNQTLLEETAIAATDKKEPREVESLFYRSLFIFLVVLALMTLATENR